MLNMDIQFRALSRPRMKNAHTLLSLAKLRIHVIIRTSILFHFCRLIITYDYVINYLQEWLKKEFKRTRDFVRSACNVIYE